MKVYLVVVDGWMESYGSEIYLYGVFSTKEKAQDAVKSAKFAIPYKIVEATLDKIDEFLEDDRNYLNTHYLGGYVE